MTERNNTEEKTIAEAKRIIDEIISPLGEDDKNVVLKMLLEILK